MNLFIRTWNFFFSSTIGGWIFTVLVAGALFLIAKIYLACYGTADGNIIADLQPLAVLIIGIASVFIAARNYWEKLGHNITCRFFYFLPFERNRSAMPYITDIILCNRKNKVEVIDKILLFSKKLGYTTIADFSEKPLVLKNYATKIIPLDSVTAWVSGIKETDIVKKVFTNLGTDHDTIINTIREGADPRFYFTPYNYLNKTRKIAKIFAVISGVLIPVKLDSPEPDLQSALPIRNTDHPANEYQEKRVIYGPRVIMVTELTLGPSVVGKEPKNNKIKVLLYGNQEKFHFDSYIDENINTSAISLLFESEDTDETRDFEKKWHEYYNRIKDSYEKNSKKNKEGTSSYVQRLENFFHAKIAFLLQQPDLPVISSKITSRIFFLREVEKFGAYPIVNKQHVFFVTGFYPTKEFHPLFEEVEVNIFAKIRKWCFAEAPPTSQEAQKETNAETDKRTK